MTSLIDVIFLLLLFFMLSSTFSKFAEVELMAAGSGSVGEPSGEPPLFLRLKPDALNLNGQPQTLETLSEAVKSRMASAEPRTILVSMGAEIKAQRLVDLLAILRGVNGLIIQVLEAG